MSDDQCRLFVHNFAYAILHMTEELFNKRINNLYVEGFNNYVITDNDKYVM